LPTQVFREKFVYALSGAVLITCFSKYLKCFVED